MRLGDKKNEKVYMGFIILVCVITFILVLYKQDQNFGMSANDEYIVITDALNREVLVKRNVNKIILQASASGGAFMTIAALKGENFLSYVVGIDDFFKSNRRDFYDYFCEFFPELQEIEEVGTITAGTFSVEQAVSLGADVVIIPSNYYEVAHNGIEQQLEEVNIPVIYIDYHSQKVEQHIASTRILGQLLHEEARAEELIDFYNQQVSIVYDRLEHSDLNKCTVYVEVGKYGPDEYFNTFGDYMWGRMVEQAGGLNVMHDIETDTAIASPEWVLQKDPDIILIIGSYWTEYEDSMKIGFNISKEEALDRLEGYLERDGWDALYAVKNKRVYSLHHAMIREMYDFASLQELAKIYYPELFDDVYPEDNLKEYFEVYLPIPYSGIWRVGLDEK